MPTKWLQERPNGSKNDPGITLEGPFVVGFEGIQTPMAQGRSTKIISMIKWIRTSRLSIKNSLSLGVAPGSVRVLQINVLKYEMCSGSETVAYLRLIDSCITQLKAQGPSRTCNESKEEEKTMSLRSSCSLSCPDQAHRLLT